MVADRIWETEWLLYNLHKKRLLRSIEHVIIDIGAGDGELQSNSLAFIEMGWSALLIDGLKSNIDKCKSLHVGRPFVKSVNAVVSDKEELVHFEEDDRFWALSGIDYEKEPNVQAVTVSSIIKANKVGKIGVCSIDLEGAEHLVLKDLLRSEIHPQILIIEANELEQMYEHRLMLKDLYKVVGGVLPNQIFFRNDIKW